VPWVGGCLKAVNMFARRQPSDVYSRSAHTVNASFASIYAIFKIYDI
jgi:hypothetical protein